MGTEIGGEGVGQAKELEDKPLWHSRAALVVPAG